MKVSNLDDAFFGRLEALSLNLKSSLLGYFGGKHLVNKYGQTVEFADYREYQLGDDIRRIDWNLFSRFEKHFLKLFTDERQMKIQIFLDSSASMGKDNPEKASYTVAVAAAMGYLAIHNMDKVSFNIMRGNKSENNYGTLIGKTSFFRVINELKTLEFDDEADIEKCVTSCSDTSVGNGLAIIISDFFTESNWKKAVDYLLYKRRQVLLLQVNTPEELDPTYDGRVNLIDSEAVDISDPKNLKLKVTNAMQKAYEEAIAEFKQDIKEFCSKRDVEYVSFSTDTPIEKALFRELLKVGIVS